MAVQGRVSEIKLCKQPETPRQSTIAAPVPMQLTTRLKFNLKEHRSLCLSPDLVELAQQSFMQLLVRAPLNLHLLHPNARNNHQRNCSKGVLLLSNGFVGCNAHFFNEPQILFITVEPVSVSYSKSRRLRDLPIIVHLDLHKEEALRVCKAFAKSLFAMTSGTQILDLFRQTP